jgi:hypothetical protein
MASSSNGSKDKGGPQPGGGYIIDDTAYIPPGIQAIIDEQAKEKPKAPKPEPEKP